jgi:hypothetical protein
MDLIVANGHVYPEADRIPGIIGFSQRNLLYRNVGKGRFLDVSHGRAGLKVEGSSHGTAFADFDNDGDADIVVTNNNAPSTLLRNDGATRRTGSPLSSLGPLNRSAIGARVHASPAADLIAAGHQRIQLSFPKRYAAALRARRSEIRDTLEVTRPSGVTLNVRQFSGSRGLRRDRARTQTSANVGGL